MGRREPCALGRREPREFGWPDRCRLDRLGVSRSGLVRRVARHVRAARRGNPVVDNNRGARLRATRARRGAGARRDRRRTADRLPFDTTVPDESGRRTDDAADAAGAAAAGPLPRPGADLTTLADDAAPDDLHPGDRAGERGGVRRRAEESAGLRGAGARFRLARHRHPPRTRGDIPGRARASECASACAVVSSQSACSC